MQSQTVQHIPGRSPQPDPADNRLIAAMIEAGCRQLLPAFESVSLRAGEALYEPGTLRRFAYFPTSSIVGLIIPLENGSSAEVAVTGNEGMVGTGLVMGSESTTSRAVVLAAGQAFRIGSEVLKKEFERGGVLQQVLLRYVQALIAQITQTAACNRFHSVDQQLCRFLLLYLDRLRSTELVMTHELIANLLGVRREGITEAMGRLQARGIVRSRRGHFTVLDRAKLEPSACECYSMVRLEYARLYSAIGALRGPQRPLPALTLVAS